LQTQTKRLMKIYVHPTFSSMLEFLSTLALSTGHLKVRLSPPLLRNSNNHFFLVGWHTVHTPDIVSTAHHILINWNLQKMLFLPELPALHTAHIVPSTIPCCSGQVAPGAETTGQAHILEGLFGESERRAWFGHYSASSRHPNRARHRAERHRRCLWLPQHPQKQSDQPAQTN
jgi:nuclear GTP-binding protein